jgi:hypothetical protein
MTSDKENKTENFYGIPANLKDENNKDIPNKSFFDDATRYEAQRVEIDPSEIKKQAESQQQTPNRPSVEGFDSVASKFFDEGNKINDDRDNKDKPTFFAKLRARANDSPFVLAGVVAGISIIIIKGVILLNYAIENNNPQVMRSSQTSEVYQPDTKTSLEDVIDTNVPNLKTSLDSVFKPVCNAEIKNYVEWKDIPCKPDGKKKRSYGILDKNCKFNLYEEEIDCDYVKPNETKDKKIEKTPVDECDQNYLLDKFFGLWCKEYMPKPWVVEKGRKFEGLIVGSYDKYVDFILNGDEDHGYVGFNGFLDYVRDSGKIVNDAPTVYSDGLTEEGKCPYRISEIRNGLERLARSHVDDVLKNNNITLGDSGGFWKNNKQVLSLGVIYPNVCGGRK